MKTTIDKFGRLVVPKTLRERLGLRPGDEIEIKEQDNGIVLRHVEEKYPLQIKEGVLIFTGTATCDLLETIKLQREQRLYKLAIKNKHESGI